MEALKERRESYQLSINIVVKLLMTKIKIVLRRLNMKLDVHLNIYTLMNTLCKFSSDDPNLKFILYELNSITILNTMRRIISR